MEGEGGGGAEVEGWGEWRGKLRCKGVGAQVRRLVPTEDVDDEAREDRVDELVPRGRARHHDEVGEVIALAPKRAGLGESGCRLGWVGLHAWASRVAGLGWWVGLQAGALRVAARAQFVWRRRVVGRTKGMLFTTCP